MENCIFCSIIKKEIKAKIVYENSFLLAFHDAMPISPTHILLIPKKHIESLNDITGENCLIISEIFKAVPKIAIENGLSEDGYRIVSNSGKNAGQTVLHLHFHLIGGRKLGWPPG